MNRTELEGKWNQVKGQFKQKYGEWFENDETFLDGKFDEVVGKIQEKSGRTREEIEQEIKDWRV